MNPLVNLAKLAVENYIKDGKVMEPPEDLPKEFLKKGAGTFVTIERAAEGESPQRRELRGLPRSESKVLLRGCIGTYLPTRVNIAEEIIHNAVAAACEDYRFGPVQKEELPSLYYTVYILNSPEPVKDIKELHPKKFGIIIKTGEKTGLLLPDLDGVDTVKQQISIACQKAGIDLIKEKIMIYKFTAEKY